MAGSLPAQARVTVILEVPGADDRQELATAADARVLWLHRGGRPAGDQEALTGAVADLPLPPGSGRAYLAGEARLVLALRDVLAGRGMAAEQVSPKAYWGLDKANASHGEPARDGG
jgi:NADPH-dependent ferric siderophore reductase